MESVQTSATLVFGFSSVVDDNLCLNVNTIWQCWKTLQNVGLHTRVAGLFPWLLPCPGFTEDFCSYQASISVEKESAKLSLLLVLLLAGPGLSLATAGRCCEADG